MQEFQMVYIDFVFRMVYLIVSWDCLKNLIKLFVFEFVL